MPARILVVDDDPDILEVTGFAVEKAGFETVFASDGLAALDASREENPDLIVLDIGLPEKDGLEVCREIRKSSDVPILFLTARDDEIDRIVGLELGADDYLTKPFSPRELVARIKAILKRSAPAPAASEPVLTQGSLQLDPDRHFCRFAAATVALTGSEFRLLATLMARPDRVLSRAQLVDALYGYNIHVSDRTIDSHIRNIRAKLAQAGCAEGIVTVHGVGLRMGACTPG
ncbi:response regulator transcription factor (plasmid) [Leisingera sp. S132]|uniref:response regulator transcription factor n=1 Tax=Leisingera sp. S132 TaxID=2867016 RepID=UPI0021A2F0B1|nr:response regulator transcription factor [Leisingera sp. S132]UWQ81614.1 response regulator transcription factor [Leisingera sp. S132]